MSEVSIYAHLSTLSAINQVGDRVHSGLMSLATAQAGAMRDMGQRLDDRLIQIDDSIITQNECLSQISEAMQELRADISTGFVEVANRLSGIDRKLERIERNTANPEETKAWERFYRASDLLEKGHAADALEHLQAAIDNDGGPAFRHIPEFHLMLGQIRIGDIEPHNSSLVDHGESHLAFRRAALYLEGEKRAIALCRAGAAAFLGGDFECARKSYIDALKFPHKVQFTHFELAKCCVLTKRNEEIAHHVHHAIDKDWNMIALIARDQVLITKSDLIEKIIEKYRRHVFSRFGNGFKALKHVLTGPTERNVGKMWSLMNVVVSDIDNSSKDPDFEVTGGPYFPILKGTRWKVLNIPELDGSELAMLDLLISGKAGLLDLKSVFREKEHLLRVKSSIKSLGSYLNKFERAFTVLRNPPSTSVFKDLVHRNRVIYTGLDIKYDALGRSEKHSEKTSQSKIGFLDRWSKKKDVSKTREIRSREQIKSDLHAEDIRIIEAMASELKPYLQKLENQNSKSKEIVDRAYHSIKSIEKIHSGEIKFIKPSPLWEPETS